MAATDPRPSQPISTAADAQKIVDGAERVMREWAYEHPDELGDLALPQGLVDIVRGYLTAALGLVADHYAPGGIHESEAERRARLGGAG